MKFPSNRFWTCVRTRVLWDDACVWRCWCMRVMTLMHACVVECDGVDACVCSYLVGSWPLKDVVAKNLGPVSPMYGARACACNRTHATARMQPHACSRRQSRACRYSRGGASALFLTVSTSQQKAQLSMMQVRHVLHLWHVIKAASP